MAADPEGLVTFEAAGKKYTAVFNFRAMKAVETHFDLPFFRAIAKAMPSLTTESMASQTSMVEAAMNLRFEYIGKLFGWSLLKFHGDMTEDEIDDLIDEMGGVNKAAEIVGDALGAAIAGGDDSSTENPPRKRKAKKTG